MRPASRKKRNLAVATLLLFLTVACGGAGVNLFDRIAYHEDYSQYPAATMYSRLFNEPVPPGVTNLRLAGRARAVRHWLWMTFNVSPATLQRLNSKYGGSSASSSSRFGNSRFDRIDKTHVNWGGLATVKSPVITGVQFDDKTAAFKWYGFMAIDQQKRRVYIHLGDL